MPFGLKDNDYKIIREVFRLFSTVDEVLVFGSRALGTEKPSSDIDLALKGNAIPLNDILKIQDALEELPIIYDFDLIDYSTISTTALVEHIDKHGVLFYKRDVRDMDTALETEIAQAIHLIDDKLDINNRIKETLKAMLLALLKTNTTDAVTDRGNVVSREEISIQISDKLDSNEQQIKTLIKVREILRLKLRDN